MTPPHDTNGRCSAERGEATHDLGTAHRQAYKRGEIAISCAVPGLRVDLAASFAT